ncbi:MAG: hypothetical protein JSV44_01840 [Candidatus Zixiibacteriota bacterium]|nr:MAG: hypothetical protein JSV44_01840 [candidate division Zixibacteria bacterium]
MSTSIRQAILLLLLAIVLSAASTGILSDRIPYVGNWPSLAGSNSVIVPPSAVEGDPPFISLDEAAAKYQSPNVIFIDARYPEDYDYGHIKDAINLPYEELEYFWADVTAGMPKSKEYVIYCSGDECESSLFLGREMLYEGYSDVLVFYGGWREWERAGLPTERGK